MQFLHQKSHAFQDRKEGNLSSLRLLV